MEKATTNGTNPAIRAIIALLITGIAAYALFFTATDAAYPWIKAFHIIAIISWMAGMLYLPRLFVYHSQEKPGSHASETFKIMEHRLLRYIINPAMIVSWVLGLWMAWKIFGFHGGWLHGKIFLVVLLSAVHGYLSKSVRMFAQDKNTKSTKHWRIVNEIPTLLMIFIVILVVVKPF
ncbi:protoporphyrinogen oxidase HemJ [Pseudochrobactrum sp. HB0163]|uniref:protoporphyrinogen oxidase HemJ n=1 Tax=Pseudochrobactrum sp. HB0163 TaxID=3450708 RepID=UPI003F6E0D62